MIKLKYLHWWHRFIPKQRKLKRIAELILSNIEAYNREENLSEEHRSNIITYGPLEADRILKERLNKFCH